MAEKASNVVLNFKMDGQVQYAETLKQINSVMNTAAKEYKNHIAAMGNDASATDKLRAEKKKLEIQMEGAQKRTKMLRTEYEAMAKDTNTTTDQLTAMYGKLLDSERAETALEKALERVNGGLTDQAQEARAAKDTLDELQNQSKLLDAEQKNLTSSFKLQNAELGENATEAEKTEVAQRQLDAQMELTERAVENLEQQLAATKSVYGENSVEVMNLETKLNNAKTTIKEFEESLEDIGTSGEAAGDGMEALGGKLDAGNMLAVADALQVVTDKMLELGGAAVDAALAWGDSQTNLQATLGLTEAEAETLNGVVQEVFKNGVVGSVEEATAAVAAVKSAFGDLNDTDLETLTNELIGISTRTGTDVQENTRAAQQMMIAFGVSGTDAADLIAAGFQNNLNVSGDFLDTLTEYSPHFAAAGYSADEMLQVISNGMENGSMNTDKAADAVKELQIRMGDGSFESIMGSFSGETQGMFDKWKNGQATVSEVAASISGDLATMTPTEQQAALSVLSSQFEDLGVDGAAALFNVGDAFTDVSGKADEMSQKTPGEEWESSLRELGAALIPIGEVLIEALTPIIEGLAKMGELFANLSEPVQTFITIFGGIVTVALVLAPVIAGVVMAFTTMGTVMAPIIGIIIGVAAAIAAIIVIVQNWGAITDWISEKWSQFTAWIGDLTAQLVATVQEKFGSMRDTISEIFSSIFSTASNIWNNIKSTISNVISGISSNVSSVFNGIKSTVSGIWDGIKSSISNAINGAKDAVSSAIGTIKSIMNFSWSLPKLALPHFSVTGSFSLNPPSVPKFGISWYKNGGIFTEPTIFPKAGGGYRGFGDGPEPEAALPLNDETLGAIGKGIAANMAVAGGTVVVPVYLDGKEIARVTTKHVDRNMQSNSRDLNFGTGRK